MQPRRWLLGDGQATLARLGFVSPPAAVLQAARARLGQLRLAPPAPPPSP